MRVRVPGGYPAGCVLASMYRCPHWDGDLGEAPSESHSPSVVILHGPLAIDDLLSCMEDHAARRTISLDFLQMREIPRCKEDRHCSLVVTLSHQPGHQYRSAPDQRPALALPQHCHRDSLSIAV